MIGLGDDEAVVTLGDQHITDPCLPGHRAHTDVDAVVGECRPRRLNLCHVFSVPVHVNSAESPDATEPRDQCAKAVNTPRRRVTGGAARLRDHRTGRVWFGDDLPGHRDQRGSRASDEGGLVPERLNVAPTSSAPTAAKARAVEGLRTSARGRSPRSASCRHTLEPVKPVAPVTSTTATVKPSRWPGGVLLP